MMDDTQTLDLFTPDNGDEAAPIEQHASHAYLGYAVSTVKSRALPATPARRQLPLRGAGAPRAALLHALPAHRGPGQLRLARRRCAGGVPVHRSAAVALCRAPAGRDRGGARRFPE